MKKTILPKKNIIAQTKTTSPFGHPSVRAQRDSNGAKEFALGKNKPNMDTATRPARGLPVIKRYKTSTLGK